MAKVTFNKHDKELLEKAGYSKKEIENIRSSCELHTHLTIKQSIQYIKRIPSIYHQRGK